MQKQGGRSATVGYGVPTGQHHMRRTWWPDGPKWVDFGTLVFQDLDVPGPNLPEKGGPKMGVDSGS